MGKYEVSFSLFLSPLFLKVIMCHCTPIHEINGITSKTVDFSFNKKCSFS